MRRADVLAGKWDDPDARQAPPFRCRWFFSWSEPEPGRIAGYFAGYEGGGAFVEERFQAVFSRGVLEAFTWNGREHVSGRDVSFELVDPVLAAISDRHFDVFIQWHDRDRWEDGYLCLAPGREEGLVMLPTALHLPPSNPTAMKRIGAMARYTGIMCRFDHG